MSATTEERIDQALSLWLKHCNTHPDKHSGLECSIAEDIKELRDYEKRDESIADQSHSMMSYLVKVIEKAVALGQQG